MHRYSQAELGIFYGPLGRDTQSWKRSLYLAIFAEVGADKYRVGGECVFRHSATCTALSLPGRKQASTKQSAICTLLESEAALLTVSSVIECEDQTSRGIGTARPCSK